MVKISVIVPAYNVENYLAETLDSLAEQTLEDFEVIIVNDGSTDSTQEIINAYTEQYSFMRCVYQENAGVSAARNKGVAAAEGKYLAFLDSDDLFAPDALENFYLTAEENSSDLVIGKIENFDSKNNVSFQEHSVNLSRKTDTDPFDKELLWNFLVGNKLYRAELLRSSYSYFPALKYSEDGAFLMHYIYNCKRINGCENATLRYRRRTAEEGRSVSQSISLSLLQDYIKAHEIVYKDAEEYIEKMPEDKRHADYLDEIVYKEAHVLIMQFYRLFWQSDDECRRYLKEQFDILWDKLSGNHKIEMRVFHDDIDLDNLISSPAEIAANPKISVIVKNKKASKKEISAFINSVYYQSMVSFEVIVSESFKQNLPKRWKNSENLVVLPDERFTKNAKAAAKGDFKVVFSKLPILDNRVFRFVYRNSSIPAGIKRRFFSLLINSVTKVLKKAEERR